MYDSIKSAKENGIFLGMTSQCIDGRVSMTVYESGRDLLDMGIIPLENMIPEVALVKAMWAVGNCNTNDEIKDMMLENYSSEFWDKMSEVDMKNIGLKVGFCHLYTSDAADE